MKKLNIKSLLVNHGEKIVFGFFGMIVLGVLAVGTSWGRYQQTPDTLKQKVKEVRDKISAETNVWPASEQQTYKVVDFSDKARQLFSPMAPVAMARYSFSPPLFHPLYRKNEPKREPKFEPVLFLIAKAGLAPLSMSATDNRLETEETPTMTVDDSKPAAEDGGEFSERPSGAAAAGPGAGVTMPGSGHAGRPTPRGGPPGMGPGGGHAGRPMQGGARASIPPGRPGAPGAAHAAGGISRLFSGMPEGDSMGSPMTAQVADVKARGVRFVSVRGVFPLAKQIENYKTSLHISHAEAQSKLEITDFILERQTAVAGPDPWKEDNWKVVNIESALEVLNECSDIDSTDPVPATLRDAVITMNLPLRLIGFWGDFATHPKIKDEELKGDAIEMQNKALETLGATINENNLTDSAKPQRRGLSSAQRDVRGMVSSVRSAPGGADMFKSMMSQMPPAMGRPPGGSSPNMAHMGTRSMPGGAMRGGTDVDRLVVNTKYLLFRYFDFDVESGMAYRYRLRLKLRNPNFELTPDELAGADPEIANGEERETPLSNISNPGVIDKTLNYFLKEVDREPYHEEKVKSNDAKPVAQLKIFDWDTTLGTVVKDVFNVTAIGGFVSGIGGVGPKKETKVLDLVEGAIVTKKERKFTSMDVLLDVEGDVDLALDQHPDLKLAANGTRGMARLELVEEAIVGTSLGEVRMLDQVSEKAIEEKWDNRMSAERKQFAEGAAPKNASRLSGLMGEQPQEAGATGRRRGSGRSPLLQPQSGMSSMPSMPGMPRGMPTTTPPRGGNRGGAR